MEISRNPRVLALLAGAVLLPASALASPVQEDVVRSETVKYRPAAASTADGAKKLYGQLEAAALRVCAVDRPMRPYFAERACVDKALDKAVADVGSFYLTAVHLKHGGSRMAVAMPMSPEAGTMASR
jgi:UrcA family protein